VSIASVRPDGSRLPQGSTMNRFLADEFPGYLQRRLQANRPPFMIADVNAVLKCGDIKRSRATLECFKCGFRRDMPLSCKRRSFCEPCSVRRQLDRSRFLHREVIGDTPVRLWTTTLPYPFRVALGVDTELVTRVLNLIIQRITRYIRLAIKHVKNLPTVANVHPGAVTTIQRGSSAIDPNVHFHSLFTDGAFIEPDDGGPLTFVELPAPTDEDLADLAWDICTAVRKLLRSMNRWDDMPSDDARVLCGRYLAHDGRPITCRLTGVAANQETPHGLGAFNVDASLAVERGDRENLHRIIDYMLAPAIRDKQLTLKNGGVLLELKRPRRDGTTHRQYTNDQMLDRLNFLVPPPRANIIRFHGVYGPNSKLRAQVVPTPPASPEDPDDQPDDNESTDDYRAWSELKSHSFPKDMMRCPCCGGRLKLVALRTDRINYRRGITVLQPG
jgi:hypothetical protein